MMPLQTGLLPEFCWIAFSQPGPSNFSPIRVLLHTPTMTMMEIFTASEISAFHLPVNPGDLIELYQFSFIQAEGTFEQGYIRIIYTAYEDPDQCVDIQDAGKDFYLAYLNWVAMYINPGL